MKPTGKHKKIIDNILTTISYWQSSNDISSPSHLTLIEEGCNLLADEINMDYEDENIEKLYLILSDLYFLVLKLGRNDNK